MINDELLDKLGITFNRKGDEFEIDCPYCGKLKHLYLNAESGAFKCHHCQETGGWARLRKEYGAGPTIQEPEPKKFQFPEEDYVIRCHKTLIGPSGVSTMEYLASRKISSKFVTQFRLGLDKKDNNPVLCIPIFEDGKPVNIKYRSLPPQEKSFARWKEGKSALFNGDILKTLKHEEPIFITEGEIDAISLVSIGFNAVGTTGGAGTIQTEWIEKLKGFKRIYIVYDSDKQGDEGAGKLAKRLGSEWCFRVKLPSKDANQFVQDGYTRDDFLRHVEEAEQFGVENVATILQAFVDLTRDYDKQSDQTALFPPWPSVKKLTGSFQPGDLITVSAKEKTGKTTWALNMALDWARREHPVLFYCLEMRPARVLRQAIKSVMQKTDEELTPAALYAGYKVLSNWPIFLGYNYKKVATDIVVETMREAYKRYGLEVIVLDNVHFLARDIQHQTQEVGNITRTLKLLAEELEIPLILIAQPRRIARTAIMGIDDLKDSSSIGADSDQIIILYRAKTKANQGGEEAFESETLVRVDASRFKAGGETLIYYDGARATFKEIV